MNRRFVWRSILGLAWMLFIPALGWALTATAVGEGQTRQAAINTALRAAIEQTLGSRLQSDTRVAEGKLDYDRIIASNAGYVRNYDVLAEGRDPIEGGYKVKLRAELDDHKLRELMSEFREDPRFQKSFQKATFDNRRVVVLYGRRTSSSLPANSMAAKEIVDLVGDKLRGYAFRVFLADQLARITDRNLELGIDEQTAIQVARQESADAVVLVDVSAGKRPTSDGFVLIRSTLGLKAYDATTGELFANVTERDRTVSRGGDYGIAEGAARAVEKAGKTASEKLVAKIVERFSTQREKFVVFAFRDVPSATQDNIYGLLQDMGWDFRVEKQYGTYLEVEVFSEADPTAANFSFRRGMRKAALPLTQVEMKGARIVYSGR